MGHAQLLLRSAAVLNFITLGTRVAEVKRKAEGSFKNY